MSPRQKVNCSVSTDIVYNPSPVSSLSDSFRHRDYNINSIQIVEKNFSRSGALYDLRDGIAFYEKLGQWKGFLGNKLAVRSTMDIERGTKGNTAETNRMLSYTHQTQRSKFLV